MSFTRKTEADSQHRHLELKPSLEIIQLMNEGDRSIADNIEKILPELSRFIEIAYRKMEQGGRLFYIGAGSSGRLGILDASECPPTFGVPYDMVIGIIAGGDSAIRRAVEFAEDNITQAWKDLNDYCIDADDVVVGITASGTTPYVVHGLKACQSNKILTACITSNPGSPVTEHADFKIEIDVGAELIAGSTRLKSGTAQKMILNMISTTIMIRLGRIVDNKMVDMQLTNEKLIRRGIKMIMNQTDLDESTAKEFLLANGSVRSALQKIAKN